MDNEVLQQMLKNQEVMLQRLDKLEAKIDDIQKKTDEIPFIKQAVTETADRENQLEQIQKDQHRILEALSLRSIQQESELKRIK